MPDPPHSRSEFTRNGKSCTGPEQDSTACYLSDAQRKDKRNLVCVCIHLFVCAQVYVCPQKCMVVGQAAVTRCRKENSN